MLIHITCNAKIVLLCVEANTITVNAVNVMFIVILHES